jgi:phosphatidylglycerol lysyltransferase
MKRRLILWSLVIAFIWLVVSRFTEIQKLVSTLKQGQWQWVLVAALLQVIYYIIFTGLYQVAFYIVEVKSRLRELLPVTFSALFVSVVAPSAGASGVALFVDDAARRGQSAARAAAGTILVLATDFIILTIILVIGLIYLFLRHDLAVYEIIGAIVLCLMTASLCSVLILGLWQPERLHRLLGWLQRTANGLGSRLGRPNIMAEDWVERNAADFTRAARSIAKHPRRLLGALGVALAAHLIDLASLYVLFLAFQQPIPLGPLVAGYATGILFLIVSPTPMGIGVVEGVMPLVFISLGIPGAVATVVTLAFRGLSFWLPLALGFVLLQRVKTFSLREQSRAKAWNVRLVAILTALMGLINVLSAVTPALAGRLAILKQFSPLAVHRGGDLTAALSGFALFLLAHGLWRHKQMAWLLALIVLLISVISHLIKGLDYEEAILAGGLAMWLSSMRSQFNARSDIPSVRRGIQVLIAALVFTLAYGTLGFYLLDRHFSVNFGLEAALRQTIVMFTQFYNPGLEPITGFGRYFATSIYIVGAVTLGYGLLMVIRPVLSKESATFQERTYAQVIVEAYGRSALARLTLFDDKLYYFSPGGSVVAYAARGRMAIALGDPIGPVEDAATTIAGFKEFCAKNDWQTSFYQTLPDYLDHYKAADFDALCIGHEGIIDLATFTIAGRSNKTIRSTINRLTRLGYRAEVHQPPIPDDMLNELHVISDEWLTMMHGREKRFFLGWFDDDYIRNSLVMAIHQPDRTIAAFVNLIPEYQRNELAIDLMRRRTDVIGGAMDFLFVSLFQWVKEQGYVTFNLGLSPLSGVGEHPDDPAVERALHYIYEYANQFYNFKGLHAFKEKFRPQWSPRFLIFPDVASLPALAITLNRVSSGDDFILDYLSDFVEKQLKPKQTVKKRR